MFFILGNDSKVVQLGTVSGPACARCGGQVPWSLCKCYEFIHLFFIPIFRYHVQYIATCPNCASVFSVSLEAGKAWEHGTKPSFSSQDFTLLRSTANSACARCGGQNPQGSHFCNHCGAPL